VKPVLLDTGVIVALLDPGDSFRQRCADVIANLGAPLVTCEPVIAESCCLLGSVEGAAEAILSNVLAREFLVPVAPL
jgi:predicted nucleic acid-binding protein